MAAGSALPDGGKGGMLWMRQKDATLLREIPRSRKPPRNRRLQPLTRCLAPVRSCCAWTALAPNCLGFQQCFTNKCGGKKWGCHFHQLHMVFGFTMIYLKWLNGDTPKLQLWWVNYNKAWDFGSDKPTWLGILVNIFRMVIRVVGFCWILEWMALAQVLRIRNINPLTATYQCRFYIFMEWFDPAAIGMPPGDVSEVAWQFRAWFEGL